LSFSNDATVHLPSLAGRVRKRLLDLAATCPVHLGPSLSITDILIAVYAGVDTTTADNGIPRNWIILSKGHAAAALYFVLAEFGVLSEPLDAVGRHGDTRAGHPTDVIPGVHVPSGSLGHGLAVGLGMALAARHDGAERQVIVLLGDGELNEGSVWEAAAIAAHHRVSNLHVIIDRNGLQQSGRTCDVLDLEPLAQKWEAFGWHAEAVDGHNHDALVTAVHKAIDSSAGGNRRPDVTIARTVKGKGVAFMENDLRWHQAQIDEATRQRALKSLAETYPGLLSGRSVPT
jgi:transketolase